MNKRVILMWYCQDSDKVYVMDYNYNYVTCLKLQYLKDNLSKSQISKLKKLVKGDLKEVAIITSEDTINVAVPKFNKLKPARRTND